MRWTPLKLMTKLDWLCTTHYIPKQVKS